MKKTVAVVLCVAVLICLCGCAGETRPDMTALSEKMAEYNENYAFDYFDTFEYENATRVFFSLCSEDDVMLTLTTEDDGKISQVNITAVSDKMKTDGERNAYMNFSTAVAESFASLSESEKKECDNALSYKKTGMYFSDLYETYSSQRHHFIFSSNSEYISLNIEYYEVIEMTGVQ